jgi:tubby-related protein 1
VRSNFLGTEFYIYDTGKNPEKSKNPDLCRSQHGVVQYETNVLGSKGPRRMKVLLPNVDGRGQQVLWKSTSNVSNKTKLISLTERPNDRGAIQIK